MTRKLDQTDWRPNDLTARQLNVVLDQAELVDPRFRKRFFLSFTNHLARSLLHQGGEPSTKQVRAAAELASLAFPPPPTPTSLLTPVGGPNSTSSSPPVEAVGASPSTNASPPGERVGGQSGSTHA